MHKKGYVSLLVLLTIAGLLPLFIFVSIDNISAYMVRNKLYAISSEAVDVAITRVDLNNLSKGELFIDEIVAENYIKSVFQQKLSLDEYLVPLDNSYFKDAIDMKVTAINLEDKNGFYHELSTGELIKLYTPTIVLEVKATLYTAILKKPYVVDVRVIESISFKESDLFYVIDSYGDEDEEVFLSVLNVINPYRFNSSNVFNILTGDFDLIPLASGGDLMLGVDVLSGEFIPNSAEGYIEIKKYLEEVVLYEVNGASYDVGDIVFYSGNYYRCVQPHSTYGDPNWSPGTAISLWVEVDEAIAVERSVIPFPMHNTNLHGIRGGDLRLDTVRTPQHNHIGVFKITNTFEFDVPVSWIQGTNTGRVLARANSATYFELAQELLITYAYGELLDNGVLFPTKERQNPRRYIPVDANNASDFIEPNIFRGVVRVPYDTPKGSVIYFHAQVHGVDVYGNETSFEASSLIGVIESNLLSQIKYSK